MAEKGFGVKEINLIGPSGTPTIESPNNLNLNAINVAISTNVSIGGTLTVSGNVSVGGTLTYEDVTNIDSVGLITARSGLIISGVTTFNTGDVDFKGSGGSTKILFDASQDQLEFADSATLTFGDHATTGDYNISYVNGADFTILGMAGGSGDLVLGTFASGTTTKTLVSKRSNNEIELYYGGNKKFETTNTGVNVTGAITVNGSALSITPTATDVQVAYELINSSSSGNGWRINGNGIVNTTGNPDLYLIRGQKYRFINNSGGSHPFRIQSDSSTSYDTGVTNNNSNSGNIDFVPRNDAPARLYYNCTNHGGMLGNIYLRGAGGQNENVGVTTFSSNILTPQQVGCAVRMSTNISHPGNNSFNSGTSWVMPFDTEVWDIGSNFNTSNYTFTAPVAGRYLCCYTIQLETISSWQWNYVYPVVTGTGGTQNTTASNNAGIVFADDGGAGVTGGQDNTAAYRAFTNTVIINLTAGQEVRMGVRGDMTATIKGTTETQWTMQLLG